MTWCVMLEYHSPRFLTPASFLVCPCTPSLAYSSLHQTLTVISTMLHYRPAMFLPHLPSFFVSIFDPPGVRSLKLLLLPLLAAPSNVDAMLYELQVGSAGHCTWHWAVCAAGLFDHLSRHRNVLTPGCPGIRCYDRLDLDAALRVRCRWAAGSRRWAVRLVHFPRRFLSHNKAFTVFSIVDNVLCVLQVDKRWALCRL